MTSKREEKVMSPINSVTEHYQKIAGAPNKIYTNDISRWIFVLIIGIITLTFGLGIYYYIFVR